MSNERRKPFPFDEFEPHWQRVWDERQTFHAPNPGEAGFDASKPKYYVLDMFPYPSGSGLHVGHPEGYTATDIIGRYKKMRGFNVLHPMGWDAFGLPAEQHAIKSGEHPSIQTQRNVDNFRRQLKAIGFGYDWQREVNTTDPGYYRWTQWIFLQLYNSWVNPITNRAEPISTYTGQDPDGVRLAFISHAPVNWCEALGTVLSNEEVIDGKSEIGGHPVERRPMRQWMLRITAYAQRLIDELDGLDWPDSIKLHQRNWIGRSEGAEVDFALEAHPQKIRVFTTRPDTLYGATYMVLAPEHVLVDVITTAEQREAVSAYRTTASTKSDLERTELAKEKTGVWTGAFAINPVNGQKIPVWIADYVLTGYGTGAIMAVPAHDERDWEFAKKFALPIREVVSPEPRLGLGGGSSPCEAEPLICFAGEGYAIHSGPLDGLTTEDAQAEIIRLLEQQGVGTRRVNYKLRDWLFSRQRYWGEPFPIVWEGNRHRALSESELPVRSPELADFKPTGTPEPPLSKATEWVRYSDTARRELNTMPQWAGSCWYYLRYIDPKNSERFVGKDAERYWMTGRLDNHASNPRSGGVDLYVGGTEHAVLHLLYARFWHKVLCDLGYVSTPEPFQKLVNQGLILGELEHSVFSWADGRFCSSAELKNLEEEATPTGPRMVATHRKTGERLVARRISGDDVEKSGDAFVLKSDPAIRVDSRSFKMSKSRGNVVNPDQVIGEYGADSLRLYEMFMGPLEATKPWSMLGVEGVSRFLARVWRLVMEENQAGEWIFSGAVQDVPMDKTIAKAVHAAVKKVGEDIETLSFNTAISAMMVCTNALTQASPRPVTAIRLLLQILNPFAPHLTEELNARLTDTGFGKDGTLLADLPWPAYDPAMLIEDEIELPVQVNGKLRDKVIVKKDAANADIESAAKAAPKVAEAITGKSIKKVIVVPGRLVNIVVG